MKRFLYYLSGYAQGWIIGVWILIILFAFVVLLSAIV